MKALNSMFIIVLSFALMSCSQEQKQVKPSLQSQAPIQTVSDTPDPVLQDCALTIGFDVWEPYQYKDVNNTVRGLDVELITSVTDTMSCQVSFVQGTWVELLNKLRSGEVDMLLGASKTADREAYAHFSLPYRMEEFALYIRTFDPKSAGKKNIHDFINTGSKIGVVGDYYYGEEISKMFDNENSAKNFVFGIMGELNIARLLDMDIDGFLEDSFVGASMLRRKALGEYIEAHGFTVKTGDIYVMLSRASMEQAQVDRFNSALADFKISAEYKDIMQKYSE